MTWAVNGIAPSPGVSWGQDTAIMLSYAATAVGDCLSVDTTVLDASLRWTTTKQVVSADFVSATTAANAQAPVCIALDAASGAGIPIRVLFRGNVKALCTPATTAGVTRLQPTTTSAALATASATTGTGNKCVAIALTTDAGTSILKDVFFDGWVGFGYSVTAT